MIRPLSLFSKPLSVVLIISLIVSAFIPIGLNPVYGASEGEEMHVTRADHGQTGIGGDGSLPDTVRLDTSGQGENTPSTEGGHQQADEGKPAFIENTAEAVRLDIEPNPAIIAANTTQTFVVKGYNAEGKEVEVPQEQIAWSIKSDSVPGIGTLVNGTLTAGNQPATGVIEAVYNVLSAETSVVVNEPIITGTANGDWRKVFEDFEDISDIRVTSVQAQSAALGQSERPSPVKYGLKAGKLVYDFTGMGGTSAAYIRFKNPDGKDGRDIPGQPKKIGFWIYGEDKKHWIRAQVQDQTGAAQTLDFTSSSTNINGWQYVAADIPSDKYPIKLNYIYLVETSNKSAGTIYIDQVSVIYEDTDLFGLEWSGVTPMSQGESRQANVLVTRKGYAEPQPVDGNVTFSSSAESVATVDPKGVITAHASGETELTATYNQQYTTVYKLAVTDRPAVPDAIQIEGPASLVLTETAKLKAYAIFGTGDPVEVSAETVFTSEAGSPVAQVTGQEIQAKAVGTVQITANYRGLMHSYTMQVKAGELKSIEIRDVFSVIVGGGPVTAKVYGDFKVEGKKEITAGAAFISANPAVATIDPTTGEIKAVSPGTTMITATVEGKTAQQLIVVTSSEAHPKRELRGAWISTVENIDWPTKNVFDPEQQRQDFIHLLDELQKTGINAVFTQIRPTSDSFFPSQYFPWSHWLTGEQGKAPSDGYDPLQFMIEEAHKRNIEFHAWINPYRISMHDDPARLAANHPARLHPDWVVTNGGKMYFNPGIPEAKDYIIAGVKEIVEKYDVEGIHMDDYFYPYPGNEPFNDSQTYASYKNNGGTMSLEDWRRANVNSIVEGLNAAIKQLKPYVKFGISPFGIWRNKSSDPTGSDTAGQQNYDGLYADTRKWMKEGWVDYLAPQIYWHFGYSAAAYEKLIDWWTKEINGDNDGSGKHNIHLYIGQGAYRVGEENWKNPDQLTAQLRFNNDYGDRVSGNILFSSSHVLANPLGVRDRIASMYAHPALIPAMPWLEGIAPGAPEIIGLRNVSGALQIAWKDSGNSKPAYYGIYRVQGKGAPDLNNISNLVATARRTEGEVQTYTDKTAVAGQEYTYAITALSRLHLESGMSNTVSQPPGDSQFIKIELGELTGMTITQTQQVKVFGTNAFGDKKEITAGITFASSESKVASINASGVITALAAGTAVITAEYQGKSASYKLIVQTQPTTSPGSQPQADASPSTPSITPPSKPANEWLVTDRDLEKILDGKLNISTGSGKTQVLLPGSAANRMGERGMLNIEFEGAVLSIPASSLQDAVNLVPDLNMNDVTIVVEVKPLASNLISERMHRLQQQSGAALVGDNIVEVRIFVKTKDGKTTDLKRFSKPVAISFAVPDSAKPSRVGIYRITDNRLIEYAGGRLTGDKRIITEITGPGQYSALAYDKSFTDVAASHWASEAIKDMAARHIISGMPDGSFSPNNSVTRGEFAALLARLLQLPASEDIPFADVKASDWFAKEVSAAAKAGIINGAGNGLFNPNAAVTREQMAVMLTNAFRAADGQIPEGTKHAGFKDQDVISAWAKQSIDEAVVLGLLRGGSNNMFHPKKLATRAEAAQVLASLLGKLKK